MHFNIIMRNFIFAFLCLISAMTASARRHRLPWQGVPKDAEAGQLSPSSDGGTELSAGLQLLSANSTPVQPLSANIQQFPSVMPAFAGEQSPLPAESPPQFAQAPPPPPFARGQAPPPFARGQAPPPFARGQAPPPFARGQAPPPFARGPPPPPPPPPPPFAGALESPSFAGGRAVSGTPINESEATQLSEEKHEVADEFGIVTNEDFPKALQISRQPGSLTCPVDCDPTVCDNNPLNSTQCFHVERNDNGKSRQCAPFVNTDTLRCPADFVRCGSVSPTRGNTYILPVSTLENPSNSSIVLQGWNLHQCIRLLFLPEDIPCSLERIDDMMKASIEIMGPASSASFPRIANETTQAEFRMRILKMGRFPLCLVQFTAGANATDIHSARFLGAENIGVVIGVAQNITTTTTNSAST